MHVLGIETSCDETAAAVVHDGTTLLANVVSSQIALHAGYGGVVPELAARQHLTAVAPVVRTALREAEITVRHIGAVAVTRGPGLVPALLVGASYAKGLALAGGLPFVGVNHFLAHIYGAVFAETALLTDPGRYPLVALVVSGGHTALVHICVDGTAEIIGATLDDAAGEAFDKAAKILDLGYPGGPVIDQVARTGRADAYNFPRALSGKSGRPLRAEDRFNFSFSGVKTAMLHAVRDRKFGTRELADLVASYQAAIVEVLVTKTVAAAAAYEASTVVLCGGVACNSALRRDMSAAMQQQGRRLVIAPPRFCTDNAAMVAGLAYHDLRCGAVSNMSLGIHAHLDPELGKVTFAPGCSRRGPAG